MATPLCVLPDLQGSRLRTDRAFWRMVFRFLEGGPDMADSTTIGCLLTSHFRARVELGRRPELGGLAGVIVDWSGSRPVVSYALPR